MIPIAIGKPKPSAPRVASTNSESRFAWGRISGNDMALLLGAPASPRMNNEDRLQAKPCFRSVLATPHASGMLIG